MKFTLFFRFFDSWYIMKYLLTETSGKQYFCGPETVKNILFSAISVNKC